MRRLRRTAAPPRGAASLRLRWRSCVFRAPRLTAAPAHPRPQVFSKPARPTAREVEKALRVQCDERGFSVPGIHTPIHPASPAVRVWTGYMLVLTLTYVACARPLPAAPRRLSASRD